MHLNPFREGWRTVMHLPVGSLRVHGNYPTELFELPKTNIAILDDHIFDGLSKDHPIRQKIEGSLAMKHFMERIGDQFRIENIGATWEDPKHPYMTVHIAISPKR
jgi:hypothetical protein